MKNQKTDPEQVEQAPDTEQIEQIEQPPEPALSVKYRVTYPHGVNLRAGPGMAYDVLRVLPKNRVVEGTGLIEETADGLWVQTADGWVNGAFLTAEGR